MKVSRIEENFSRTDLEPNYSFACGYNDGDDISPIELARLIENGRDELDLIDVREPFEFDLCKIEDSISIPLGELVSRSTEISKDRTKVFICHHGIRSRRAMDWLSKNGIQNMLILKGGIDAWALEVDSKMERY